MNFIKHLFCNHQWKILEQNYIPIINSIECYTYNKKSILLTCEKCGKLVKKVI